MSEPIFVSEKHPFEESEEEIIISLALDRPEFFSTVAKHLKPEMFRKPSSRFVLTEILRLFKQHDYVPTRHVVSAHCKKVLTAAHDYHPILALLERELDPREAPYIEDNIRDFCRKRQFELLYQVEAIQAFEDGDYDKLVQIVDEAASINAVAYDGVWVFRDIEDLFSQEVNEKLTCGFGQLDEWLNLGGPSRKEVLAWLAPTNVGKSIVMVNCGVQCARAGYRVLHVTLEMSKQKTQRRYLTAATKVRTEDISNLQMDATTEETRTIQQKCRNEIREKIYSASRSNGEGDVFIAEFETDSISVDDIRQLCDYLRKSKGWSPDVIIIDYLELMLTRNPLGGGDQQNKEHLRQKKLSNEVAALAQSENALVITATQGNRDAHADASGKNGQVKQHEKPKATLLDMDKMADSFAKGMRLDYVISINQTPEEYNYSMKPRKGKFRFFVAKNREGPKYKVMHAVVNYENMFVEQEQAQPGVVAV